MRTDRRAFTIVELLIVVVVVFTLAVLLLPAQTGSRTKAVRINCVCNLKQVGLAFRLWAGDNKDLNPMQALTNQAGARLFADATNGFHYFQVMSNELSTPKVLICPADPMRTAAGSFTTNFDNRNISYFVGLDAKEEMPQTFLAGDRNLSNGQPMTNGLFYFQTNQVIGWTKELHNLAGNIAMGDGSVQQLSNSRIGEALAGTGLATNRLLFP